MVTPLLNCIDLQSSDRILSIKEIGNIDSNFLITHLIKQILHDANQLTLVIFHQTIGHYHNVGKKLGYDFLRKQQDGDIETIEPLKDIVDDIGNNANLLIADKELIVKSIFYKIRDTIERQLARNSNLNSKIYLIIDDISHFLDLGVDLKYCMAFINYFEGLLDDERVFLVVNTHVCGKNDAILANCLNYTADVNVEVMGLKTGLSREVTGLLSVEKRDGDDKKQFHFKAFDRGVKTFHLGESVYNLYK